MTQAKYKSDTDYVIDKALKFEHMKLLFDFYL